MMFTALQSTSISIDTILKEHGMKGVFIILGISALVALGKAVKVVAQMIKSRIEASDAALAEVVKDARQERDSARQQREREANAFLQSLKEANAEMRRGFDEVLREIRDSNREHDNGGNGRRRTK